MGIDCDLLTEEKRIHLDRLYVFNMVPEAMEEGKVYTKQEFIKLISVRMLSLEKTPNDFFYFASDKMRQKIKYFGHWLNIAKENAGERNMLVSENNYKIPDDWTKLPKEPL